MIERLHSAGVLAHIADDFGSAAEIASRIAIGPIPNTLPIAVTGRNFGGWLVDVRLHQR